MIALHQFRKRFDAIFFCFFHILLLGSSGLNCEFIRREYGFSISSNITFMGSGDKPILILKMLVKNFCRFQYFADFDFKIVLLGLNSFESIAF